MRCFLITFIHFCKQKILILNWWKICARVKGYWGAVGGDCSYQAANDVTVGIAPCRSFRTGNPVIGPVPIAPDLDRIVSIVPDWPCFSLGGVNEGGDPNISGCNLFATAAALAWLAVTVASASLDHIAKYSITAFSSFAPSTSSLSLNSRCRASICWPFVRRSASSAQSARSSSFQVLWITLFSSPMWENRT